MQAIIGLMLVDRPPYGLAIDEPPPYSFSDAGPLNVLLFNNAEHHPEPSPSDLTLTQALKTAQALVDIRLLDHP